MKAPTSHNKSIASKKIKKSDVGNYVEIDSRLLIIPITSYNLNLIMKKAGKKAGDITLVYLRYYQCALIQKTNQPRATFTFMMKGLQMGRDRLHYARKVLKQLGMIEDIQIIDEKGWPIANQFYVKIVYYQGTQNKPGALKTRCADKGDKNKPGALKTGCPEKHTINAYRKEKRNAYRKDKSLNGYTGVKRNSPHGFKKPLLLTDPKNPKNKKYRTLAIQMMEVVIRDSKYTTIKPNEKEWTIAIRLFCERDSKSKKVGIETIKTIIKYHDDPGRFYLTPIHQPKDLKGPDKLQKIGEFMQRVHEKPRNNNNNNSRVIIKGAFDHSKTTYEYV